MATTNGNRVEDANERGETATWRVKAGLAQMLKGGVIMDVVTAEHARIAEEAGAAAVMALERVPSDIRADGGVARMSHVALIEEICQAVTIPRDGQGAHRPLRRGADPRGDRRRLHRRVRGADAGRRGPPHRQARLPRALRLRLPRPRRGAAPDQRGRGDDPHQGRGRHRRHRRGGAPHARRLGRHPPHRGPARRRTGRVRQGARRAARAGAGGQAARSPARRQLLGGRRRHSGRRGADDAARRGRGVRRLRHLQVEGAGQDGDRDRQGP